jgi:hypothetical protein
MVVLVGEEPRQLERGEAGKLSGDHHGAELVIVKDRQLPEWLLP